MTDLVNFMSSASRRKAVVDNRLLIYNDIDEERDLQDGEFGPDHMDKPWLSILTKRIGKVASATYEEEDTIRARLIQVAAVAVAWVDAIDEYDRDIDDSFRTREV